MKKIGTTLFVFALLTTVTSCGVNSAIFINHNQNATQVQLTSNNYKVVDKISGSAEVKYICLIGGSSQKQLYENAYSAMVNKANLINSSRALINVVTEEHVGGVPPFYFTRTVTFTAHVIEFTK
jgi:hypothetical protein